MVGKLLTQRLLNKLIDILAMFFNSLIMVLNLLLALVRKFILDFQGLMVALIILAISLVLLETFRDRGVMLEPILNN